MSVKVTVRIEDGDQVFTYEGEAKSAWYECREVAGARYNIMFWGDEEWSSDAVFDYGVPVSSFRPGGDNA